MEVGDKVKLKDDMTWHELSHWSLKLKKPLYIIKMDDESAHVDTVKVPLIDNIKDYVGDIVPLEDLELY